MSGSVSVSIASSEGAHLQAKQEVWGESEIPEKDESRKMIDRFAILHQRRVKMEITEAEIERERLGKRAVEVRKKKSRPEFNPMKVMLRQDRGREGEMHKRGLDDTAYTRSFGAGKENRNFAQSSEPREGFRWIGERRKEHAGRITNEQIESGDSESLMLGDVAQIPGTAATVGPWDSVSQMSVGGSRTAGGTRSVITKSVRQTQKKRKNRRLKPIQARQAAELSKALVQRHLSEAARLWKMLEFPTKGGPGNVLESFPNEAVRYAKQGRRFIELALEHGTIRAKHRVRDEFKAYCYANQLDHRTVPEDCGFDAALASYGQKVMHWRRSYYRSR